MPIGRHRLLLTACMLLALVAVVSAQAATWLQALPTFGRGPAVGLVAAFAVAALALVAYLEGRRRDLKARAVSAEEAGHAQERARELERLMTFWQALTQSFDLETIRDVAEHYLPELAGTDEGWVVMADEGEWRPILGRETLLEGGVSLPTSRVAAGALARAGLVARPDGIEHDGYICFPLIASGSTLGVLGLPAGLPGFTQARRLVIGAAAALFAVALRSVQLLEQVRENSLRDDLTGCANRGHALEVVTGELLRARRSGHPVSMIMLDIDRFKQVNDRYGHLCGDAVLAAVGKRIRDTLRGSDLKCRYGGEEFLILLPETPLDGACRVAENLRRDIAALAVSCGDGSLHVTCSLGIAALRAGELDPKTLIARADEALYRAKHEGRDCVRIEN